MRAATPTNLIIARELEILGSHGMQAHRYPQMLDLITEGRLQPDRMVARLISLAEAPDALVGMDRFELAGVTIIDRLR